MTALKLLVQVCLFFVPWPLRRVLLKRLLGFQLAADSRIGFSVIGASLVCLDSKSRIGHLNVFKGLNRLVLGEAATIGRGNWISAYPLGLRRHFAHVPDRNPSLLLGPHSAVTNRHILDCTDCITVGDFATFGGFRSQVLTHSIDVLTGRQHCAPIAFGRYSFVGTGVLVLGGAELPASSVLAAGSVLTRAFQEPYGLYAGNPAQWKKALPVDAPYFTRTAGFVI